MSCNNCNPNPCSSGAENSAACESTASTVDNFVRHFFGEITKTEVNGVVSWELPCDLDVGLENNPRNAGEGLACYFLRLFHDGIVGATGPQGPAGENGEDGHNAYSVTITGFTQPTSDNPNFSVKMSLNPVIRPGQTIYIDGSGYHFVNSVSGDGTVFLTLVEPKALVWGYVSAGKLVAISGPRGVTGAQGPVGPQGPIGPTGPAGAAYTATNGTVPHCEGNSFDIPVGSGTQVTFGIVDPTVTLPLAGTYLVLVTAAIEAGAGINENDVISLFLYNATAAAQVHGSLQEFHLAASKRTVVTFFAYIGIGTNNHTIQLYAKCTTGSVSMVNPDTTSMAYVRIS